MAFYQPPSVNYGLANQANQFQTQQARMPFQMNLPGYQSNVGQRALNTRSYLQGQVPQDVTDQIIQRGGERGVAMGSPGSPNANAAWLRALGLTSLGLQQQGSQQFSQEIQDTPYPQLWNPLELYLGDRKAQQELEAAKGPRGPLIEDSEYFFPGLATHNRWTGPSGA